MALDVLRVLQREPEVAEIVLDELSRATSGNAELKRAFERLQTLLQAPRELDRRARSLVETLALVTAGALLHEYAPAAVSEPFIATRLAGAFRATYGHGLSGAETRPILERALAP